MGRIWKLISSVQLTMILLCVSVVLFLIGALYANSHYAFFNTMNQMPIQQWLSINIPTYSFRSWWLPLLIFTLFLLGANTFTCTIDRIRAIYSESGHISKVKLFTKMTPSLIHICFLVVMLGHCITFICGKWIMIPLRPNAKILIQEGTPELAIKSIDYDFFSNDTLLKKRIKQISVSAISSNKEHLTLSFLNPVKFYSFHLHLDVVRPRLRDTPRQKMASLVEEKETCNKSERYHQKKRKMEKQNKLYLLAVYDPGLNFIVVGFICILFLLVWFYGSTLFKRNYYSNKV